MPKKFPPHLAVHLHNTTSLTLDKIDGFAEADRLTQAQVLSILRERTSLQSDTLELAIYGLMIGFLGFFVAPATLDLTNSDPLVNAIVGLAIGALGLIALLPVLIPLVWRKNEAQLASSWLHAYEAELARRRTMSGVAARRWRKSH